MDVATLSYRCILCICVCVHVAICACNLCIRACVHLCADVQYVDNSHCHCTVASKS